MLPCVFSVYFLQLSNTYAYVNDVYVKDKLLKQFFAGFLWSFEVKSVSMFMESRGRSAPTIMLMAIIEVKYS